MTVIDIIKQAEKKLKTAGCNNPRLESEVLFCSVAGWKRYRIYLEYTRKVQPALRSKFNRLVFRRANREPLQHLTRSVEFMGREFISTPSAMIPRPETEILVDITARNLSMMTPESIIEVGTGGGVVACSLALDFPCVSVVATDISFEALLLTRSNMRLHGIKNIKLVNTSLLSGLRANFDAIVANLPYIPADLIDSLQPEVSKGDPRISLNGGQNGWELINSLIHNAHEFLKPGGFMTLEIGENQAEFLSEKLGSIEDCWNDIRILEDFTGSQRFIIAWRK